MIEQGPITTWPGQMTPTHRRRPAAFRASVAQTDQLLRSELLHIAATDAILEHAIPDVEWRLDGRPRAHARRDHPGVVLRANAPFGNLVLATDRFTRWQDNLRAIALSLHDLRRLDRYGTAPRGQQYSGFTQLPAPDPSVVRGRDLIRRHGGPKPALMATHPDHGGDRAEFEDIQAALERER